MIKFLAATSLVALCLAAPAAAVQRFQVTVTGELFQQGPNDVAGLPADGATVTASWEINLDAATQSSRPQFNGTGTAAIYKGAVRSGSISITDPTLSLQLTLNSPTFGNITAIDNGSSTVGSPILVDVLQNNLVQGVEATTPWYEVYNIAATSGSLPSNLIITSFGFGNVAAGAGTGPTLLTSVDNIDPFSLWQPANAPQFFFTFGQGTPGTFGDAEAVPQTSFQVINQQLSFRSIVPEPGTWAMLIAGFGLIGGAARRKRALAAA